MIKKRKILNYFKLILGTSLVFPTFFVLNKSLDKSIDILSNNLNSNVTKATKQTINNINSFADYNPMYSDANSPLISTNKGFLGRSNDNGILVFTSYNGVVAWMVDVRAIPEVVSYYKSVSITDISSYTIKSTITVGNYLVVLFSDANKNNSIVFALEIDNGRLYTPAKESDGSTSISQNIKKVNDGSTVLFEAPSPINSLYVFPDGKGKDLVNNIIQITITDRNLGSLNLSNDMISRNAEDDFVGFVSGHVNTLYNFILFIDNSTKNYYIKVVDSSMRTLYNKANDPLIFEQNIKFEATDSGKIKKPSDIPKHGIRSNASVNAWDDKFIFVFYGKNSIIRHFWYQNGQRRFQYRAKYTFSNNKPYRVSKIYNTNEIVYSLENSSDNTIFGVVDMGNASNSTSEENITNNKSIKNSSTTNQTSEPWPFINVYGSNNKAYLYMDPITKDNKVKYEWNDRTDGTNLHFTDPVDLVFKKYTFNNDFFKFKIPSVITDEELKNNLSLTNSNGLTINIENRVNDNDNGLINFNYNISYTNWWNNSSNYFNVYIDNSNLLYKFNDFNFDFVTSQSVDDKKFEEINKLRSSNYPNSITKQNVRDNFIKYNIKDRNGSEFNIIDDMITLTPNNDEGTLKVEIDMTKGSNSTNLLPIGINNFSSYYKKSYTFENFISLKGYTFSVNESTPTNLMNKHPSEISFYDVISEFVQLGNSYSRAESDWILEKEVNDITGEFTIKKLTYNNSRLTSTLPDDKKNIITSTKKYSNFKSSVSLLNETISMKEFDKTQILNKKPSDVWQEYKSAFDSNDDLAVGRTLLFQAIQQNIVVKKTDLVLNITNEATMDQDSKIDLSITIKNNAVLVPKIGNENIVFSSAFESELKKQKSNYYPFAVSQKVLTQNYDLDWKPIDSNKDGFELNNSKTELTINLDNTNWNNLNNKLTATDFVNSLNSYENQIKELFDFNENYEMKIGEPTVNILSGIVWLRVDFVPIIARENQFKTLHNSSLKSSLSIISKQIVIKGFKIPSSSLIQMVPLLISMTIAVSIVMLSIFIFLRSKKRKNFKQELFATYKERENKSYLGYDESKKDSNNELKPPKKYI